MEEENKEKNTLDKLVEQVDSKIAALTKEEVKQTNVDYLYKLIDIKKDIGKIKHMEREEDNMMYRGYGNEYGRGYGENYGRRGVPGTGRGRYRGEEMLDEMKYHYGNYQDSYNTGNYGAKEDSSYKMTEAFKEFVFAVGEELEPKDKMMFKQAMQEMVQKLN